MRPLIGITTYREQAQWGTWHVPGRAAAGRVRGRRRRGRRRAGPAADRRAQRRGGRPAGRPGPGRRGGRRPRALRPAGRPAHDGAAARAGRERARRRCRPRSTATCRCWPSAGACSCSTSRSAATWCSTSPTWRHRRPRPRPGAVPAARGAHAGGHAAAPRCSGPSAPVACHHHQALGRDRRRASPRPPGPRTASSRRSRPPTTGSASPCSGTRRRARTAGCSHALVGGGQVTGASTAARTPLWSANPPP